MYIDVTFTPAELARSDRSDRVVVVIDVVRASTTIVQGIASGCQAFLPVPSILAARRAAREIPQAVCLLGGERRGVRIRGFDLGNSPEEYTSAQIRGKLIVFTTTNGTAAIKAARGGKEVLMGAFVNMGAAAELVAAGGASVILAAAGRGGRPVLDDVICAGMYVERIGTLARAGVVITDGARIALEASRPYRGRLREMLAEAASGRALVNIGLERDLDFCSRLDVLQTVPRVVDGRIIG